MATFAELSAAIAANKAMELDRRPDFSRCYPEIDPLLKIKADLYNTKHGGPHYDVMQSISGGTDQVRVSPDGEVLGGTTNIGKKKMHW